MVVGFVNSGIMRLSQAAGVIMGANIGTTITSWILSLTGLQGDSLLLTLCKPATFTPVLALIGVCLLLFAKGDKKHDAGSIMIGFAVLMTGMEMMSGAVKPLANVPEFTHILLMFTNPILGVIAGALLTAIIQSSSASVGILQALCVTGAVQYSAALPIIMGQNIGTCVTALISSIGASKNARRAALIHLYFNIIGTVLFMAVFYAVNAVFPFAFMNDAANAAGIAVIHTTFNVVATAVLLPFSGTLEKLATLTIRDNDTVERIDDFQLLDERFLSNPAFAVEQCKVVTDRMAELTREAIFDAISLIDGGADDYIAKPFGVMEMIARVKALLRRSGGAEESLMTCGNVTLDSEKRMVYVDGKPVELTYKEFELLKLLMKNHGIVISRDVIMERVWDSSFEGESRTIDVHVRTLRQKLGDGGALIKTIRNVGYMAEAK